MSITFGICDDDKNQNMFIRGLLNEWAMSKSIAINIIESENGDEFLFKYSDNPCDLLLLDIEMPGINGMELAKRLRANNDNLPIIFITGFSEFMSYGYDVRALHYLLKPVDKDKLFGVIDKYISTIPTNKTDVIIQADSEKIRVNAQDILYCEAFGKSTKINLKNQKPIFASEGISSITKILTKDFHFSHRSYLINMRYVKTVGKDDVTLDNGDIVPLSRRQYKAFNEDFIKYYIKEK